MSTQETAKLTIELTLSNDDDEIPGDTEITEGLWAALNTEQWRESTECSYPLAVSIRGRSGELDSNGTFLTPEEADEISEYLGYYETYIENRGYKNMSSDMYEKELATINRLRNRLNQR